MAGLMASIWADPTYKQNETPKQEPFNYGPAFNTEPPKQTASKKYKPAAMPPKLAAVKEDEGVDADEEAMLAKAASDRDKLQQLEEVDLVPHPVAENLTPRPAPKPGFNEDGLPLLFRPDAVAEARAINDGMTKGGYKKRPGAASGLPAHKKSTASTSHPRMQKRVQGSESLMARLASLEEKEKNLRRQLVEVRAGLAKAREEKEAILQEMGEKAKR